MPLQIVLKAFWPSAYTEPFYSRLITYFNSLFQHVEIEKKYDVVEIWTVCIKDAKPTGPTPSRTLLVQFSGEGFYHDVSLYGMNLIPSLEGPRIVPHTLAGMHIYTNGLIEKLKRPRVWNEANHDSRRFCSFVVSNAGPEVRKNFFILMSKFKRVDSCGRFANNWGRPIPDPDSSEYLTFLSNFRFMICFENCRVDNYMTEKLINAYVGDSIPIYWGCPQTKELLNPEAFLLLDEEPTTEGYERLFNDVVRLENDKEAYKKMYEQPLFKNDAVLHPSMLTTTIQQLILRSIE